MIHVLRNQNVEKGGHRYRVESEEELADGQMDALLDLVEQPVIQTDGVLVGRSAVTPGTIPGIGSVVVKHYTRGGVLGKFVSHWYVGIGELRSRVEYRLMRHVRELGVNAPEPIACVACGGFLYRTWLVSRAVEEYQTLAQISVENSGRSRTALQDFLRQLEILIVNGIFHVDLHPGNVLVKADGTVFIIDFDKARKFSGNKNRLRDRYLCRWRRAIIKHALPDELCEELCAGLRRDFSGVEPASVS